MNGTRTGDTGGIEIRRVLAWFAAMGIAVAITTAVQAAKVDWNIPADPAAQRQLCADYPSEPSPEDISDFWDSPARRRIVACEALMEAAKPDPDLYYYAGRLWLDIAFPNRARDMFRRGAEAGSTKAMLALGYWHWEQRNDPETMLRYYKMAAERGDPVAQTELGLIYRGLATYATDEPLPKDPGRGLELLRAAAEQGYPIGQYALGMTTFQASRGNEEARQESLGYIKAAARAGVYSARKNLAKAGYEVPELTNGMRYPSLWVRDLILNRP